MADQFGLHENQRHQQLFDRNTVVPMQEHSVLEGIEAISPMSSRGVQAFEKVWVGLVSSVYG